MTMREDIIRQNYDIYLNQVDKAVEIAGGYMDLGMPPAEIGRRMRFASSKWILQSVQPRLRFRVGPANPPMHGPPP